TGKRADPCGSAFGFDVGDGGTARRRGRGRRSRDGRRLVVRLVFLVLVIVDEPQIDHDSSPGRSHVFSRLLERAYRRRSRPSGRGPNNPRPILSIVLPSCTATSRSSVMPIERTGRVSRSASA